MAKVILICGKICSGKTSYARSMMKHQSMVLLSSDELISTLFHPNENEYHDKVIENAQNYLLQKSTGILNAGVDVILDWGFWTQGQRASVGKFYADRHIQTEWYYLDIEDAERQEYIEKRNRAVLSGKTKDYYVDQGLMEKMNRLFEAPEREEVDHWIHV